MLIVTAWVLLVLLNFYSLPPYRRWTVDIEKLVGPNLRWPLSRVLRP